MLLIILTAKLFTLIKQQSLHQIEITVQTTLWLKKIKAFFSNSTY